MSRATKPPTKGPLYSSSYSALKSISPPGPRTPTVSTTTKQQNKLIDDKLNTSSIPAKYLEITTNPIQ